MGLTLRFIMECCFFLILTTIPQASALVKYIGVSVVRHQVKIQIVVIYNVVTVRTKFFNDLYVGKQVVLFTLLADKLHLHTVKVRVHLTD